MTNFYYIFIQINLKKSNFLKTNIELKKSVILIN